MIMKYGLAVLLLSICLPAFAAEPTEWNCTWKGRWGEQGNPQADVMEMQGFLFAADGGYVLKANSKDAYGLSHIRGGCGEECWVEQKYADGPIRGQSYFFTLKARPGPFKNGLKSFAYTGTWGKEEDAATHKGTIQLDASCKPFSYGRGDQVYERMDQLLGWDEEHF